MPKTPSDQHIDFLDGLRGIAISLVVIFHYWQISWLDHTIRTPLFTLDLNFIPRSGFIGVEIFFFLSGFCLFLPHARLMFENKPLKPISNFIYKRFIKIYPSYILSIFVVIWLNQVEFDSMTHFVKVFLAHAFFTTNHLTQFNVINGVFWSLAVEVQFYILFPLIAFFFRKSPYLIFLLLCATAFIFRFYYLLVDAPNLHHTLEHMPASLDLFACGMLSAYLSAKAKRRLTETPYITLFLTAISIVSCLLFIELLLWFVDIVGYGGKSNIWQVFHRLTLGLTLILIAVSGVFSWKVWVGIIANRCFVFFGLISYNLYIWHQIIAFYFYEHKLLPYTGATQRGDFDWQITFTLVVLAISIAFSAAITYFFERPLMNYRRAKPTSNTQTNMVTSVTKDTFDRHP